MRRAQPVGRGHAPRAAAGAVPRADPRGLAQGGLRLRRGHQGGRVPAAQRQDQAADPDAAATSRTTATRSISVSAMARFQQRQAEEAGAYVLTETAATQLIVEDGRVVGRALGRQGPRQGRRAARQLRARAPTSRRTRRCSPRAAGATSPAPRSRSSTSPTDREPQVWELGVKEVWKVPKPLDRVIHTLGPWPLKLSAKYGQIGGTWIYPMKDEKTGEDLVSIGFVIDLEYADATTSAHDLLQHVQAAPARQGHPRGRRARRLGREGAARRRLLVDAQALDARRGARRRRRRHGRHGRAEGRPPQRSMSGKLAAESIYAALVRGESSFDSYEQAIEDSIVGKELYEVRNTRQPFQKGFVAGRAAGQPDDRDERQLPRRRAGPGTATTTSRCSSARPRTAIPSPTASTPSTSSPRCSSPATRRATTRPTTSACSKHVPREIAETWRWMCPAGRLRDPRRRARARRGRRDRQLHQLRAVRRDHRQGRPPDDARGRRRAAVPDHLSSGSRRRARAGALRTRARAASRQGAGALRCARNLCA